MKRAARRPWTPDEEQLCRTLTQRGVSASAVARELNQQHHRGRAVRNANAVVQWRYKQRQRGDALPQEVRAPAPSGGSEQVVVERDTQHYTLRTNRVLTLEQALELKEVDLTKWEVARAKLNTWEIGAKGPDGRICTAPLHQVDFSLVPKRRGDPAKERAALLAEVRQSSPFVRTKARPAQERGVALEVAIFDLHLGKQGWAEECGENTDLANTEVLAETAVWTMLERARAYKPERVVLPYGNDAVHIDNRRAQTTAGTPVDADTRYWRIVRRSRALWSRLIRTMVGEVGPVTVPIVPGNHDEQTTIMVGELLAMEFAACKHVHIDNTLYPRKYWHHGCTLLGFTHGNDEKHGNLPLLMATEQPELWAKTQFREWHLGHYHHAKETRYTAGDSFNGVGVRIISSLSGSDLWHVRKGYRALRMAEAFLWDAEDGYVGHVPFWHKEPLAVPAVSEPVHTLEAA